MVDRPCDAPLSNLRAELASFDHAYAVAVRRREAGEARQYVVQTGNPIQPYQVISGDAASDEKGLPKMIALVR